MIKEGTIEHEIYLNLLSLGLSEKYSKPGIYSISIDDKLVYIGKAKDMLVRLANHIKEIEVNQSSNKYRVLRQAQQEGHNVNFDVIYYSPYLLEDQIIEDIGKKEGELIRLYLPVLNYQIPKEQDFHKYYTNPIAKTVKLENIVKPQV